MTGSRRSGIRIVIPPRCAEQPVRITCRQLRPENVLHCPPLSEGEGLACRVLQLTPATFLAPVLLEVPHFTPVGDNREIVVLRSETGKKWSLHRNTTNNDHLTAFLATSISNLTGINNNNTNNNNSAVPEARLTTITTSSLPQFLAVLSRPRQETRPIGPEGGLVSSPLVAQVQCMFPPRSLTKPIPVGVSVCPVCPAAASSALTQGGASPVTTVEPRRRKFHKPITVTLPLPGLDPRAPSSSQSNSPSDMALVLLCSMSGAGSRAVWEDVTRSTPLSFSTHSVQFSTVVSAQFWLLQLPQHLTKDVTHIAEKLFRAATRVPYMARIWLYWRQIDTEEEGEVEVRVVVSTEGERVPDSPLEEREGFQLLAKSGEVEVAEREEVALTLTGNLLLAGQGEAKVQFKPFAENRATFSVRRGDLGISAAGSLQLTATNKQVLYSGPIFFPLAKS